MYITLTEKADLQRIVVRRARFDAFRASLEVGVVLLSAAIVALGAAAQARIIEAVQRLAAFDGDDPFDAHDLGDVEVAFTGPGDEQRRALVFFRIDEIDSRVIDTPGSAEPGGTTLMLTIMLASEW